jgi:hypothetical protein
MLHPDDISSLEEGEDTVDLLRALPEIRHNLGPVLEDDEFGLRSLLAWSERRPPSWTPDAA